MSTGYFIANAVLFIFISSKILYIYYKHKTDKLNFLSYRHKREHMLLSIGMLFFITISAMALWEDTELGTFWTLVIFINLTALIDATLQHFEDERKGKLWEKGET